MSPTARPNRAPSQATVLGKLVCCSPICLAVDTEFQANHTLTIQAVARWGSGLQIQIYHSPNIPSIPHDFDPREYLPRTAGGYGRFFDELKCRPPKLIQPALSPVQLLNDVFDIRPALIPVTREEGYQRLDSDGDWGDHRFAFLRDVPRIRLQLIAHFLPADILRIFGRDFYRDLLQEPSALPRIELRENKSIRLAAGRSIFSSPYPIVEFAADAEGALHAIELGLSDTNLPFGSATLESLSRTFLDLSKSSVVTDEEKRHMRKTFRRRPGPAYGYAMVDAVTTLLVHEAMEQIDREIYETFGISRGSKMAGTVGKRVANFLLAATQHGAAKGSVELAATANLKQLMAGGSSEIFRSPRGSRYGETTGKIHGGLTLSRSPQQFAHRATGMFRDVDMSQCYSAVLSKMNVYWGRPIVFEPGSTKLTVREALKLVQKHCEKDAWLLRVTGPIKKFPNTLIPTTVGARTSVNFKRRRQEPVAAARLYSQQVDSGILTWATWQLIQALPAAARREYERLNVDSLIMYPRQFVADDGPALDKLRQQLRQADLPWQSVLSLPENKLRHVEQLDEEFVSLRFPIHKYSEALAQLRRNAQKAQGKGSGLDAAFKLQSNTMFGVLASTHLPTNNMLAANQVTAFARAAAYAMLMALNGLQVITDGCTFRKDRIPAVPLAQCLKLQPDYPLRHADDKSRIPFLDPAKIPDQEQQFIRWYRRHVAWFFGAEGNSRDIQTVVSLHRLEFKRIPGSESIAFDALLCDGSGNYLKCREGADGDLVPVGHAFRGYRRETVAKLTPWLMQTYLGDSFTEPAPIVTEKKLLKLSEAKTKAESAIRAGAAAVILPLGLSFRTAREYRVIKPSAFVFQSPRQRQNFERQLLRFFQRTGCGIEVLALRRGYRGRQQNSIEDLAAEIFRLIQQGQYDFSKTLHWNRQFQGLSEIADKRHRRLKALKRKSIEDLRQVIDVSEIDPDDAALLTGYICRLRDPMFA